MAETETTVALTALIVAAVALFIATAQLLQQIFGTADGYRRCQSSVIGPFASTTTLKWRWREFRFETRYTTPMISLEHISKLPFSREGFTPLQNSLPCRQILSGTDTYDRVNWLQFLTDLRVSEMKWNRRTSNSDNATVKLQERSWDFMPPEIVKPLASSTIGAIIVFAHRLGMRWTEFRPYDAVMHAEGGGKSLTSSLVRGVGIVFQYINFLGKSDLRVEDFILAPPEQHVDMMKLGIITTPYYHQTLVMVGVNGSKQNVRTTSLRSFGINEKYLDANLSSTEATKQWKYCLNDLLGFLMDFIPNTPEGDPVRFVPDLVLPSPYPWKPESPTSLAVGRLCLVECLRRHIIDLDSVSETKAFLTSFTRKPTVFLHSNQKLGTPI